MEVRTEGGRQHTCRDACCRPVRREHFGWRVDRLGLRVLAFIPLIARPGPKLPPATSPPTSPTTTRQRATNAEGDDHLSSEGGVAALCDRDAELCNRRTEGITPTSAHNTTKLRPSVHNPTTPVTSPYHPATPISSPYHPTTPLTTQYHPSTPFTSSVHRASPRSARRLVLPPNTSPPSPGHLLTISRKLPTASRSPPQRSHLHSFPARTAPTIQQQLPPAPPLHHHLTFPTTSTLQLDSPEARVAPSSAALPPASPHTSAGREGGEVSGGFGAHPRGRARGRRA